MNMKQLKQILLVLDSILLVGFLVFSIMFFITNRTWNPMDPSFSSQDVDSRLFWRDLSEKIMLISGRIHLIGHGLVLLAALFQKKILSAGKLVFYYLALIFLMLACIAPFWCLDNDFRWDYSFAVLLTAVRLLPLWGIAVVIGLGQRAYLALAERNQ